MSAAVPTTSVPDCTKTALHWSGPSGVWTLQLSWSHTVWKVRSREGKVVSQYMWIYGCFLFLIFIHSSFNHSTIYPNKYWPLCGARGKEKCELSAFDPQHENAEFYSNTLNICLCISVQGQVDKVVHNCLLMFGAFGPGLEPSKPAAYMYVNVYLCIYIYLYKNIHT